MSHELIGDRIYLDGVDIEVDHRGHGSHQASVHRGALAALVRRLLGELPQLERVAIFADYCRGCGIEVPPTCHCENDE